MRIAKKTVAGVTAPTARLTVLGAGLVAAAIALTGGGVLLIVDLIWIWPR
jgi:hypothetical protein